MIKIAKKLHYLQICTYVDKRCKVSFLYFAQEYFQNMYSIWGLNSPFRIVLPHSKNFAFIQKCATWQDSEIVIQKKSEWNHSAAQLWLGLILMICLKWSVSALRQWSLFWHWLRLGKEMILISVSPRQASSFCHLLHKMECRR